MIVRSGGTGSIVGRQRQREQVAADREQHVVLLEHLAHRRLHARHARRGTADATPGTTRCWRRPRRRPARRAVSASATSSACARLCATASPAMISGRFACASSAAASSTAAAIAAQPRRDARRRHQLDLGLGLEDVAGQRQEHRAGRRRQRGLGGAMHHPRQVGEAMHLGRPFHQRPRDRRQVGPQDRLGDVEVLIVLAGGDEDRARPPSARRRACPWRCRGRARRAG